LILCAWSDPHFKVQENSKRIPLERRKNNSKICEWKKILWHYVFYSEYFRLIGYTNNDCGGNIDNMKSIYWFTFHFGIGIVSWASRKHPIVKFSSVEVEYVATTSASCQTVWMRRMLKDLLQEQHKPTTIFCENNSVIMISQFSDNVH
jgi:hypothetical protein